MSRFRASVLCTFTLAGLGLGCDTSEMGPDPMGPAGGKADAVEPIALCEQVPSGTPAVRGTEIEEDPEAFDGRTIAVDGVAQKGDAVGCLEIGLGCGPCTDRIELVADDGSVMPTTLACATDPCDGSMRCDIPLGEKNTVWGAYDAANHLLMVDGPAPDGTTNACFACETARDLASSIAEELAAREIEPTLELDPGLRSSTDDINGDGIWDDLVQASPDGFEALVMVSTDARACADRFVGYLPSNVVEPLDSRTNGFADLQVVDFSEDIDNPKPVLYVFDGSFYVPVDDADDSGKPSDGDED